MNGIGLDCSSASGYGLWEIICLTRERYSCPSSVRYDRSGLLKDFWCIQEGNNCCWFEPIVSTEQIQNPFRSKEQKVLTLEMK